MTLMGYDRHRQRSVRAASGTVRWGSRIQPERKSEYEGHVPYGAAQFGPCTLMAGWCQRAWLPLGQRVGTPPVKEQEEGRGVHGGMSVQKEQCRVSDRGFLPPDKARHRVSHVPWAAAGLSSPGRRARLAPLCRSSLGRRTGCFSCCG